MFHAKPLRGKEAKSDVCDLCDCMTVGWVLRVLCVQKGTQSAQNRRQRTQREAASCEFASMYFLGTGVCVLSNCFFEQHHVATKIFLLLLIDLHGFDHVIF